MSRRIILLYGPTASGKSSYARRLAEDLGGVVINADAMQLYRNLHLLTARPGADECSSVPHYLYGVRDVSDVVSAVDWARMCADLLTDLGKRPVVICGGSGFYLQALVGGLSYIPQVSAEVRTHYESRLRAAGLAELYKELSAVDKRWAEAVGDGDVQRILRGLGVYRQTGVCLSDWHGRGGGRGGESLLPAGSYVSVLLLPPRDLLWERSLRRIGLMVSRGCLLEVINLLSLGVSDSLPLMRAIGVREFGLYLGGGIDLAKAKETVWYNTRRYIKRQFTWARGRYDYDVLLEDGEDIDKVKRLL